MKLAIIDEQSRQNFRYDSKISVLQLDIYLKVSYCHDIMSENPSSYRTIFSKMSAPCFVQSMGRKCFEKGGVIWAPKFFSLIFQLNSVRIMAIMTVHACTTALHIFQSIFLHYSYVERSQLISFHLFFKKNGAPFLYRKRNHMNFEICVNLIYQLNNVLKTSVMGVHACTTV